MRTIHKYTLPAQEVATIEMPAMAQIIRVGSQDGFICIWAIVDTENAMIERRFHLFKTGGKIPNNFFLVYIGCAAIFIQQELMLYIFEDTNS